MAATYSYQTGDGITADYLALNIFVPDSNAGNTVINGQVQAAGGAMVAVSATQALPAAPGSGSIFFIIEVNRTTGAVDLQQSTTAFPTVTTGCDIIFQDVLTPTTTDPALDPSNQDL